MTDSPPGADALTGASAGRILDTVIGAAGGTLHDWHVRSVHRRGSSSAAVVHEVDLTDGRGHRRDRLYVTHVSTRPVPDGAARLDVDGAVVHVWPFPHDPYLPGLPAAVNRAEGTRLLRRLGLDSEAAADSAAGSGARPAIRTRSYRPTRRAVVELRPGPDLPPAAYVKLLGGRTPGRVARRARRLATVHHRLLAELPVPPVLEQDPEAGRVVLGALTGTTLRTVLRQGGRLPDPATLSDLLQRLHALPALPGDADPDRFADVGRHVTRLQARLPARAADLDRLARVAATVGGPRGTVHGDLHDGQVLVAGGEVSGLLDVDGAGTGTIAHDLGRLLAHLDASRLQAPALADRVDAYVAAVAGAVADLAPARDVTAAAAAAWVGLATGPLRVASHHWRDEVGARIDRALAWAAGGP